MSNLPCFLTFFMIAVFHQGVVYQLLTTLVDCMKPELVCHLISRLQESADGGGKGGGRHEVLAFVENLASNQAQTMLARYALPSCWWITRESEKAWGFSSCAQFVVSSVGIRSCRLPSMSENHFCAHGKVGKVGGL